MNAAYDAIIVGARCAGSPTAMLLARKGYRVLVVDCATFPGDTVSSHVVHPLGAGVLARWGLLDRLTATGCPPIHTYAWALVGDLLPHKVPPDPRGQEIPNHRRRDRNANQRPKVTRDDDITHVAGHSGTLGTANVLRSSSAAAAAPRQGLPGRVSSSRRRDSLVHRAYGTAHQHAQMGDARRGCGGVRRPWHARLSLGSRALC
jgi:glycine/D-amino acid oxidase-like deaminating enzyme